MEQPQRKKYLKLDDEAWKQISTFVDAYFQQQEGASNATYKILFAAISAQFPGIVLERKAFTKNVASIEKLKRRAGIQIPTEHLRFSIMTRESPLQILRWNSEVEF